MADSSSDRQITSVPYPETDILTEDELFNSSTGLPSISLLKKHLQNQGRVDERCALRLVEGAQQIFQSEPNIVEIEQPVTIVGDIHGQFYDFITILSLGGEPATTRYLFLGDYVDRGQFQCECIFLLFALKIKYPQNITLLRGNHETRQMTKNFQFKLECKEKYLRTAFYQRCMEAFDTLPICALVDSRFLCMHGGLSPDLRTLADIEHLDRFQETPHSGPLCDLLWADPRSDFDDIHNEQPAFEENTARRCSYFFSYYACRDFLLNNHLTSIIRGHEVQKGGVRFFRESSQTKFPVLISLFSAPNYCDSYKNIAAILKLDRNGELSTVSIEDRKHPFILPNYENGFQFAERFLVYYTTQLLLSIFNMYTPDELAAEDGREDKTGQELLNKKRLIEGMEQAYAKLERNNKISLNLRGLTPSYEAYKNLLARPDIQDLMEEAEKGRVQDYDQAFQLDQIYEERPEV